MSKQLKIKPIADEGERVLFYKEVVSVLSYYNRIIKNPEKKLKDSIRISAVYGAVSAVVLVMLVILYSVWNGSQVIKVTAAVLGGMYLLLLIAFVYAYYTRKKLLKSFLSEPRESTFTIDDTGVELKNNANTVRLSWENIAFVRKYDRAVCFFGDSNTRFVISVYEQYYDEIKDEIKAKIYE
ncbi:MAG: hypothetical protein IKS39_07915 [Clostridia bacterium]|nr:hypothetical protein [Clostridia bacterium]MBR6702283.1 hypothetical protein [Clostridia bacterium]